MSGEDFKTLFIIIGLIIGLIIVGYVLKTPDPDALKSPDIIIPEAGDIVMEGMVVCLPHKDTSGPQTLECALGLQDAAGRYYGLKDVDENFDPIGAVPMNVPVRVKGKFVAQADTKYQSIGLIEVEDISLVASSTPDVL